MKYIIFAFTMIIASFSFASEKSEGNELLNEVMRKLAEYVEPKLFKPKLNSSKVLVECAEISTNALNSVLGTTYEGLAGEIQTRKVPGWELHRVLDDAVITSCVSAVFDYQKEQFSPKNLKKILEKRFNDSEYKLKQQK